MVFQHAERPGALQAPQRERQGLASLLRISLVSGVFLGAVVHLE